MFPHLLFTPLLLQSYFADLNLVNTIISVAGIGGLFFVAWYITFRYFTKRIGEMQTEHGQQYHSALKQNQLQFEKFLDQNNNHFISALDQNQKTNDRFLNHLQKDNEHKTVLIGILKEVEFIVKEIKFQNDNKRNENVCG